MVTFAPGISSVSPAPPVSGGPFTISQICEMALKLDPEKAARLRNGSMAAACTIGVFTEVLDEHGNAKQLSYYKENPDDGELIGTHAEDPEAEYAAILARVSTPIQADDGWSIKDQIERGIAKCIQYGWAFRIFNDMGLSGRLPMKDNHAIRRMRRTRKLIYEELFMKVFLDKSIATRYTPAQKFVFNEYKRERGQKYMIGETEGNESPEDAANPDAADKRKRETGKPSYRPGLTVMLQQFPCIHTMLISEQSRLCRSAVLFAEIIDQMRESRVKAFGTISEINWMNHADRGSKMLKSIFGEMAESQLEEVLLGSMRGILTRLMSGRPHANTPFWLTKSEDTGIALLLNADIAPEKAVTQEQRRGLPTLRRLLQLWDTVDAYGEDRGVNSVATMLQQEGWPRPSKSEQWTAATIRDILTNHALRGIQFMFGVEWQVFPPVLSDMEFWAIQSKILERSEIFANSRSAAHVHLLAGILRCSCGEPMVRVPNTAGSHTYTCSLLRHRRDDYSQRHISINQRRIDDFINRLMTDFSPPIIRDLKRGSEGNTARYEASLLAERAHALRTLIREKEAHVEVDAEEAVLRTLKSRDHKRFALRLREAIDDLLEDDLDYVRFKMDIQKLEARQNALQRALEKSMPRQELDRMIRDIQNWDELDTVGKNLLLLDLLVEIRFEGDHPNENLVMVKRTLDEEIFPPIPVKTTLRSNSTVLREFPSAEEMQNWIVGMLDAAIAYSEDTPDTGTAVVSSANRVLPTHAGSRPTRTN